MPDPSPALIDTIARAFASIDGYGPDLWDDTQSPHEYWYGEVRGKYRDQARAALAAMPQPIGYAGAWLTRGEWTTDLELGDLPYRTFEDARRAGANYNVPIDAVVALVPVEDQ